MHLCRAGSVYTESCHEIQCRAHFSCTFGLIWMSHSAPEDSLRLPRSATNVNAKINLMNFQLFLLLSNWLTLPPTLLLPKPESNRFSPALTSFGEIWMGCTWSLNSIGVLRRIKAISCACLGRSWLSCRITFSTWWYLPSGQFSRRLLPTEISKSAGPRLRFELQWKQQMWKCRMQNVRREIWSLPSHTVRSCDDILGWDDGATAKVPWNG